MTRATILLVEDETVVALDIRKYLVELEYSVPAAVSTGCGAVEKTGELKPDLVLMDIMLPGEMDGIEAAGIIKKRFDIPVIFLSASADDSNLQRSLEAEPAGFIHKPVEYIELKYAIEIALIKIRHERRLRVSEAKYRYLVNNANSIILRLDTEGRVTYFNQYAQKFFGYSMEEIIGEPAAGTIVPETDSAGLDLKEKIFDLCRHPEKYERNENENIRRNGERVWIAWTNKPLFDASGELVEILCVGNDITERKRAENELKKSESRFRLLVEGSREVFFYIHDERNVFEYVSPSVRDILGYDPGEMEGKPFDLFMTGHETDARVMEFTRCALADGGRRPVYNAVMRHRDGRRVFLEITEMPLVEGGKIRGIQGFARDITARMHIESALKESEDRYRELFDNANDIIYTHDLSGNFTSFNKKALETTGYTFEEAMGMNISRIVAPEYIPRAFSNIVSKTDAGIPTLYEVEILTKEGNRVPLEVNTRLIYQNGKPVEIQGIGRDTTAQKRIMSELRLSEEKFSKIFHSSPVMISLSTLDEGRFVDVNDAGLHLLGYTRDELIGRTVRELGMYEEDGDREKFVGLLLSEGFLKDYEMHVRSSRGDIRIGLCSAEKINISSRPHILLVLLDITDRKRAEEQVRASLREKETMLKEIHHRVKNNFQIITSLLNLQSHHVQHRESREMFRDSQNRIKAMSIIHERLYLSGDLSYIDFADYMSSLLRELGTVFGAAKTACVRVDVGGVRLNVQQAIPCGLIVNELITNALKYAFPVGMNKKAEIGVRLTCPDENTLRLTVYDNGIGLPEGVDLRETKTLGLYLVKILSENQLGGTLDITCDTGTEFIITFIRA